MDAKCSVGLLAKGVDDFAIIRIKILGRFFLKEQKAVAKKNVCTKKVGARDERGGCLISCSPKTFRCQILRIHCFSHDNKEVTGVSMWTKRSSLIVFSRRFFSSSRN